MVLLFFALMIKSSVFAVEFNPVPEPIMDFVRSSDYYNSDYNYIAYKCENKYGVFFLENDSSVKFYSNIKPGNKYSIRCDVAVSGYFYVFNLNYELESSNYYSELNFNSDYSWYFSDNVINSSMDFYTDNTYTTLFFQGTPLVQEKVLAPIVEEKKETMGTVLQEIVSILPMILVVVVSLVGLRKALSMLFSLLRQS